MTAAPPQEGGRTSSLRSGWQRVLVPVAFDDPEAVAYANEAVSWACDFARPFRASLQLLYVCPPLPPTPALRPAAYDAMVRSREVQLALARERLGELQQQAEGHGISCATEVLEEGGSVPERVVQAADALGVDLIAITSHGRRGVQRLLLGSIAERVAHLSSVPVLLFKEPGRGQNKNQQ